MKWFHVVVHGAGPHNVAAGTHAAKQSLVDAANTDVS